jgi:outer membrane protein assembly factor BamB
LLDWRIDDEDGIWAVARRGALAGAGQWDHAYANPANTACSDDHVVDSPTCLQWFGEPGPELIVDRHHRAMPPLARDGRLFVQGDGCVFAVDAFNGFPLWKKDVAGLRGLAAPRDAVNMAVAHDYVYVAAKDSCLALDVDTGETAMMLQAPQLTEGEGRDWGYLACVNDLLLGTGRKPDATYTHVGLRGDYEIQWGDFKRMVTGDYLFCLDRHTGEVLWTYRKGVVIHPAVAVGEGRVFFVESRAPKALADDDGKITLDVLLEDASVVALDLRSGEQIWRRPAGAFAVLEHIIYLSYANGTLLVAGSRNHQGSAWYALFGLDAQSGTIRWRQEHPNNVGGIGGDHGEQIHHPVIVGDTVYAEPCAYSLATGQRVDPRGTRSTWAMERRRGCGTLSASADYLFYRDANPVMFDLSLNGDETRLTNVNRPGCWINIVPACGLVLVPEASSGCTCAYPVQTSLALIPADQE